MADRRSLSPDQIAARDPSYSFQELLDRESVPVPQALREDTQTYLGSEDLPIARWTSREFFALEVDKVWRKTWQMACRESQLRSPGDYLVYEIVDDSILLTRTQSGALKGYYNACLHRGRVLKRGAGQGVESLRCPFHGWTWSLEGDFQGAPCQWDFPHVDPARFRLPEVRVDTWGGWVFINMCDAAPPLAEYMGVIPEHFVRWDHEHRYVAAHVEKVINANWKTVLEAFIESYHAIATHPQLLPFQAIDNSQYDVWGDHVSRTITAYGVPNPSDVERFSEQDALDGMMALAGSDLRPVLAPGQTAREKLAELSLPAVNEQVGEDLGGRATMSELMDSTLYLLFPNFAPWGGYQTVIMDIYLLTRYPRDAAPPEDAPTVRLGAEEPFRQAAHVLGAGLANVFDQDGANLPQVQRGLRASRKGTVTLGNYQEVRIRHFHQTLDKYIGA